MAICQTSKIATADILNLRKDTILYLLTVFEPNPSILNEVMAIIPKSKMAAGRHFEILMTSR